ncbi:pyriculol/pyriculariol biosynthesis cluster transcription factor 1-like [Fagus crenata]
MEQEDQFFWFNDEQYNSDGGFYNAEQQYFPGGSTSDYGHGLQISEAINYRDGGFTGLYNDMHQFQVGFTSNHGLQNSEAVNTIADQQIQLSPEIIVLEDDSDIETDPNSPTLGSKLPTTDINFMEWDLDIEENTTCIHETNQNSSQDEVQAKASEDSKMKFLVGSTSNHGLQDSEAVNNNADQQIQLPPEIIVLEDDSDIELDPNSPTLDSKIPKKDINFMDWDLNLEENTTCVDETNQNSGQDEVQAKASKDPKRKFQVCSTSNHELQNSEAVNNNADQQIQLPPEIIDLENDSDNETNPNSNLMELDTTCVDETNQNSCQNEVQAKASGDSKGKTPKSRAKLLRIGEWQEVAIYEYEESLIVKCYVKTQKLIWEIIQKNCTLKKKIEIGWSDISAIRSRMVQREFAVLGVLEIELHNPPSFYKEIDPQPRKHITWTLTSDFTNDEALIHRIHYLEFHPASLKKFYAELIKCPDLFKLSQKPFTSLSSPYFNSNFSSATTPYFGSLMSLPAQGNRASTDSTHHTYNGEHGMNTYDLGSSVMHFSGISQSCPQSLDWAPPHQYSNQNFMTHPHGNSSS